MQKLNYLWRIVATGICFFTFGLGALFISSLIFPLQALFIKNKSKRKQKARFTIHKSFAFFIHLMQCLGILTVNKHNFSQLQALRGKVVIANHPSLIDVVAIIAYLPNANCVVKSALFKNPFLRGVVKRVGYIDNDSSEQLFIDCANSLSEGSNIVVFPEGTRSKSGQPLKFKRGAANIAIRCQTNYQPITISVVPTTLTKQESWYDVPHKKFVITLTALAEIDNSKYFNHENISLAVRALTRETEQYFCKELKLNG
ncbi:lysophospholipid acyltransferase family protein [Colwellia sp. RSH04]|uniref:lysophospholipid acyltransferase family protein n=1 Tax=Colwellia sp. RSH04 TaxID=2305464 RepID=UPI000E575F6E|nr:lysophospholipid acyltransferase family protein [Colwellia sp. RSH04]RHW75786.1 1-acyl-sn-glycerol-3-phosphate acyltransferase [Colwellia sp. RSH04]